MLNKQEFNNLATNKEALKSYLSGDILQATIGTKTLSLEYALSNELIISVFDTNDGSTNSKIELSTNGLSNIKRNKLIDDFLSLNMEFEPVFRTWVNNLGLCYDLTDGSQVLCVYMLNNKQIGRASCRERVYAPV